MSSCANLIRAATTKRLVQGTAGLRPEAARGLERGDVVVAEVPDDRLTAAFGLLERDQARAAADERVAAEASVLDHSSRNDPLSPRRRR